MRILIINPFGIGDCLFTTPLICAIKQRYPDSYLAFWCNERVAELFKPNKKINRIFPLSRGDIKRKYGNFSLIGIKALLSLYGEIKDCKFDIALDFSLDHRYGLLAKLAGIKMRIGFDYKSRGRFLTKRIEISGYNDKHIVEYYLQLLGFLGIEKIDPHLELFVDEKLLRWAKGYLAGQNISSQALLIGISPGAGQSWGKDAYLKQWEPEKFAATADSLLKNFDCRILLFGNSADKDVCDEVYKYIQDKERVLKIYPGFTLSEFSALLSNCRLLLANDGGPLHMAVALNCKTVSIFGPVSDIVYGPYPKSDSHVVIKANFDCRPCYKDFRLPDCRYARRCITDIKPSEVFEAARRLL